jgi:putative addiction module antidote
MISCPGLNIGYNPGMAITVKVTTVGNSTGIVLPKEILERLRISKGDILTVTETPDGLRLRPYDEDFATAMTLAEEIMREDRDVLRKLAQ